MSEQPKHTPGPWYCNRLIDSSGTPYATNYTAHIDIGVCMIWAPVGNKEQEANAHLISAAPELLEALKLCVDFIEIASIVEAPWDWEPIKEARAAIAKAEGRRE